jgi:hypothetical protein
MFEKTFLPYALNIYKDLTRDPIDCCIKEKMQSVIEVLDFFLVELFYKVQYCFYDRKFLTKILIFFLIMISGPLDGRK